MATRIAYRSVFISDVHLGSKGCRARDLGAFLKRIECEHLYLVGDIIDMWRLRQRWHWPSEHNDVARRILKLAKRGTRVTYIPGNHDEHARQYVGLRFGDVRVRKHAVHTAADGRTYLVTHGDEADLVIRHARLVSVFGSWAYDTLIGINSVVNHVRRAMGMEYWSLSKFLKLKVKSACTFIARYEETLMSEARSKGYSGVICGHIHKAEARTDGDVAYYNCGDWVEGGTALVEHADGTMQVIDGRGARENASLSAHTLHSPIAHDIARHLSPGLNPPFSGGAHTDLSTPAEAPLKAPRTPFDGPSGGLRGPTRSTPSPSPPAVGVPPPPPPGQGSGASPRSPSASRARPGQPCRRQPRCTRRRRSSRSGST